MTPAIDPTCEPALRSFVESANRSDHDFPIQNLPFGVFRHAGSDKPPHIGVAIGDHALDLHGCIEAGLLASLSADITRALRATTLNALMALGRDAAKAVRAAVSDLLREDNPTLRDDAARRNVLLPLQSDLEMLLPCTIGDYTDFYASVHHATNIGSMFRPDNPLMPNYKHLPVGYHGRASSIVVSGTDIIRPSGQTRADDADLPVYGPCRLLDYELEMGFFVGAGNAMGRPIAMHVVHDHIFGMCIVNDWSARDVQKWEYQPLGPFNAKNFATSISPWVVTLDALQPYLLPGPLRDDEDPPTLEYLQPRQDLAVDITCEVFISSAAMREQGHEPQRLSRGNFRDMFWTIGQMLTHHTSTGCNARPGDLLASGTVSGPEESARGCLLELTWRGENPIDLPDGTQRKFLQDGDEVIINAYCQRGNAARIGFGSCRGIVLPAV
jgi:fumarylacetoacetase